MSMTSERSTSKFRREAVESVRRIFGAGAWSRIRLQGLTHVRRGSADKPYLFTIAHNVDGEYVG
jgi:hypothetical protein